MITEVTGCDDCPFSIPIKDLDTNTTDIKCFHPKTGANSFINTEYYIQDNKSPDWCPLKQEELTIKLK